MRHFEYFWNHVRIIFVDENFELEIFYKRDVVVLGIKPIAECNPRRIFIALFYARIRPSRLKFSDCIFS